MSLCFYTIIIFSGSSEMLSTGQIFYVYKTVNVEHSSIVFSQHLSLPRWAWCHKKMAAVWTWSIFDLHQKVCKLNLAKGEFASFYTHLPSTKYVVTALLTADKRLIILKTYLQLAFTSIRKSTPVNQFVLRKKKKASLWLRYLWEEFIRKKNKLLTCH